MNDKAERVRRARLEAVAYTRALLTGDLDAQGVILAGCEDHWEMAHAACAALAAVLAVNASPEQAAAVFDAWVAAAVAE